MRLGKMISAYQMKHDLEARELAAEIGISQSSLSRIKRGKSLSAHSLAKIILWMTE